MRLTPEQKTLNKEAVALRNKAFYKASREHRDARERVNDEIRQSELGKAHQRADEIFQEAIQARNLAEKAIQDEIAKLHQKLSEVTAHHATQINAKKEKRDLAWKALHESVQKAEKEVDEAHGDIAGCYSPAAWRPLEEFLPLVGCAKK